MELKKIIEMIDGFNKVCKAGGNLNDIIDLFASGPNDSNAIISALTTIESDLQSIINAIQDQSDYVEWTQQLKTLNSASSTAQTFGKAIASIVADKSQPSGYAVTVEGKTQDFLAWASDNSKNSPGPLSTIQSLLNVGLGSQSGNLYNLFMTGDFLSSYENVWTDYWQNKGVKHDKAYSDISLFDGTVNLMQQTFEIVGALALVYEAIYEFACTLNNSNSVGGYGSIQPVLIQQWGSCADYQPNSGVTPTSVWGLFGEFLYTISTYPLLPQDPNPPIGTPTFNTLSPMGSVMQCSYNQDNWLGDDNCFDIEEGGQPCNGFVVVPFTCPQPNGFISAFRLGLTTDDDQRYTYLYLQCQISTFDSNMNLISDRNWYPNPNDQAVRNAVNNPPYLGWLDAMSVLYVNPPTPKDNNTLKVIYGFKLGPSDGMNSNRIGIQLQYADIDLSTMGQTNGAPSLTFEDATYYVAPFYNDTNQDQHGTDYCAYTFATTTNYFDSRPSANSDLINGEFQTLLGIATNATFIISNTLKLPDGQDNNLVKTNRLYIQTQMAPTLYMADFVQPANLIRKK